MLLSRRKYGSALPKRLVSVTALALLVGLAGPQASMADDASFKRVVLGEVKALVKADAGVATTLRDLAGAKSARRARAAVGESRAVARRVAREARAERPSSESGELAKAKLLRALNTQVGALSRLDAGLRARLAGDRARARRLLGRGQRRLRRAAEQGARAGALIRALPHR